MDLTQYSMTVKFSRYILPLQPTAIVLTVLFFGFLLNQQTEWSSTLPKNDMPNPIDSNRKLQLQAARQENCRSTREFFKQA